MFINLPSHANEHYGKIKEISPHFVIRIHWQTSR